MAWGEAHEPRAAPVGATGTTAQIEQAHQALDRLGVPPGPLGARVVEFVEREAATDCSCGDRTRANINHRTRIPCWTYVGMQRVDVDLYGLVVAGRVPVAVGEMRWWHEKLTQTLDPEHHSAEWQDAVRLVLHGIETEMSARRAGTPVIDIGTMGAI